jgi:hypothetical protein
MATTREVTVGTKRCTINTRFHVQPGGGGPHPAVATALVNGVDVTDDKGNPLECYASTEEDAAARMVQLLEQRFGAG